MFTDKILNDYADVVIWGLKTAREETHGKAKPGDIVVISCDPGTMDLVELIDERAIKEGWHTETRIASTDNMIYNYYKSATDEQLGFIMPWAKLRAESINGYIAIMADNDLFNLESIDPKRFSIGALARKPLRDIWDKRESEGKFGWSLAAYPTIAQASQTKMSLREYTNQIIKACYLDQKDPVRAWMDLKEEAERIKQWLWNLDIEFIHVESERTDLVAGLGKGRRFMGVSGHNIPSFEIFTSPDWRLLGGKFYAEVASFRAGQYVKGVEILFKEGEAISATAEEGNDLLQAQLDTDKGARRVGELSFTDRRHSKIDKFLASTLFDENYGGKYGNCHIALGKSFVDCYEHPSKIGDKEEAAKLGFNDSAIHWDFVNQEDKVVTATLRDGSKKVIYASGEFQLE